MRIQFTAKSFQPATLKIIMRADKILDEYQAQGFTLTLRQLYYQFVARDMLPNTVQSYKRLGSIISDARLAGIIDWDAIEDRMRNVDKVPSWDTPADLIDVAARQYCRDPWDSQRTRCEVWIEKDALVGVIEPVCRELRVPWFACRGYVSQSAQYEAAVRFAEHIERGQDVVVFHLGDHDPSGIDMTRENQAKMDLMCGGLTMLESPVEFERLALNMDQVRQYRPPPNPAKETDSRFESYIRQHGQSSWELDALEPRVISDLIRNAVENVIDEDRWEESMRIEREERTTLAAVSGRWTDVVDLIDGGE